MSEVIRTAPVELRPRGGRPEKMRSAGSHLPRIPRRVVTRERLLRRLDRLSPLTVVQGLPGTGKTTLVADWLRNLRVPQVTVVWITLDSHLEEAERLEGMLRPSFEQHGDVVIVLDDAHHLAAPAADVVAGLLATHPGVHVVACADREERLTGAAGRLGINTQLIPGAELTLSAEELPTWAEVWGHHITAAQAQHLHRLVGGWIRPLQLVLDSTPSWDESYVTREARNYFTRAVAGMFAELPELIDARRLALGRRVSLLTAAAILDDSVSSSDETSAIDAPAVCAARRLVTLLERTGLLWPVSGDGTPCWRFPRLVRRTLAEAYEREEPQRAKQDHRAIAGALHRSGRADLAGAVLHHARKGEDWPLLSRIWFEDSWQLLDSAPDEFARAYADLPAAVLRSSPDLQLPGSVADVVARTSAGDPITRARFVMRHYMQVGLDYLNAQTEPANAVDRIERLTAAMVALRHEGRIQDALVLGPRIDRELALVRRREQWARRSVQTSRFLLEWGLTRLLSCDCSGGIALLVRAYETNPTGLTGSRSSALLSLAHAMLGDASESRRWLARHEPIEISGWWTGSRAVMPARLARAALALDRLDTCRAAQQLQDEHADFDLLGSEMWPARLRLSTRLALLDGDSIDMLGRMVHLMQMNRSMLNHEQNPAASLVIDRCYAELLLSIGEVDQVRHLLGERSGLSGWQRVVDARVLLMAGDEAGAQRSAVAAAWAEDVSQRDRAELLMIGAVAALRRGRTADAATTFQRAHASCRHCGTLEPYLTCSPGELTTLLDLAGVSLPDAAAAAVATTRAPYPTTATTVDLSPREREVLKLMHAHDRAADIARELGVSVNTVRKQQASVYAKLGVHDRASALLVAEQMGLAGRPRFGVAATGWP